VEVELRRVVEENRRLCGMLEELTRSYGALYQQLLQVTQHRQHPADLMINRSSLAHVSAISLDYIVLLAYISRSPVYIFWSTLAVKIIFSTLFPLFVAWIVDFDVERVSYS